MTFLPERKQLIAFIQEAYQSGSRLRPACDEAGICERTYRRWLHKGEVQEDQRPACEHSEPANKLSEQERETILEVFNQPAYADLPPTQVVPLLLDEGIYHASESSCYRILKSAEQVNHRGRAQPAEKRHKPTSQVATKANECWSWDITYLPSTVKGLYYYLYLFEDIFSRKIVGDEVYEQECGEYAAKLVQRCILKEGCLNQPLVLHSDNGAPMKSLTMRAKLEELGVASSYSRPRVSNDNPFSEALFKTLKYRHQWPTKGFSSLEAAREWVQHFVHWYNHEHKHSKINFVSPAERHAGLDVDILAKRKQVLEAAKQANPLRWSGDVRNCKPAGPVTLNPDKPENVEVKDAA
ncbi:MAG: Mobile element protein [uncultured Thiotrichaceae bacterium]|uniref:Mobile element protein n=1 Tax=uncultured Thiotrichaceae bacterium TaxID=298394 RepID=A0A6S6SBP3_9GAMM|nr:MAG: Mobile element protein [uncultured Thiotrichaceae bacterium]